MELYFSESETFSAYLQRVFEVGIVTSPEVSLSRGPHVKVIGNGVLVTVRSIPPD